MLNILYGRAGAGKTNHIMQDIKRRMSEGETGMLLIVPEQYSHDAERQLCAVCGDPLSLHAEVLSFTRLSRHVLEQTGTGRARTLDKSGQILVLHRALESVLPNLKVFGRQRTRVEMLESLLSAVREFKSMCITPEKLGQMASKAENPLADKLRDFALITGAYDALLETYGGDAAGHLTQLADNIGRSSAGSEGHIYFDGFNDFTAQELRVIEELLKKGADVTVCLTCDIDEKTDDSGYAEVFELPRRTAAKLSSMHEKTVFTHITRGLTDKAPELLFLEKHLFSDNTVKYTPESHSRDAGDFISVYAAPSVYTQCEYAAAVIWDLVRQNKHRWRDISVVTRDFTQLSSTCEQVFDRYGIPYFSGGSIDIRTKPPIALLDEALGIAATGWEYQSVLRYLKTGLLKLTADDIAVLENYVIKWNIRGTLWLRAWKMPPSGYSSGNIPQKAAQADEETLKHLNTLREEITAPLMRLRDGIKGENACSGKLRALYEFITDISLSETLSSKAREYASRERLRQADEYRQLINIITDAMDQMYTVSGESVIDAAQFHKMMMLVLSQHDVGVIPVSLDRVTLGAMTMNRRRDIKCLIILDATDENMPRLTQNTGVLSDNERKALSVLDDSIPSGLEQRLYREMNMIYSTLTLPSEKLIMMHSTAGGEHPSFIIKRLCGMFGISAMTLKQEQYMSAAEIPYGELANMHVRKTAANSRQPLSQDAARLIYGSDPALSASRVDSYYSCPYKHFLYSGLRLRPRKPAQFDAAEAGSFMHYVLDGVLSEIKAGPGFESIDDTHLDTVTKKYITKYQKEVLLDFEGKNSRFIYLFNTHAQGVFYTVRDTAEEMKYSKFTPAEFEMDISRLTDTQRGFIDRVDIYESGDKLYLRVIDYKTRKKAYTFDIADVFCGRDMQMLIYLFAAGKHGDKIFGKKPEPAGVLYVPARDVYLSAPRNISDEELSRERQRTIRRSGLVLDNAEIIEAMESSGIKRFLPVRKSKDGNFAGESLVSAAKMKKLEAHIDGKLSEAKKAILSGANDCKPYYKNAADNACTYCDYSSVCGFDEELGDRRRYVKKMDAKDVWEKIK